MTGRALRERDAVGLDRLSKQIIEQLQQDGRRPYAVIAKAVGRSEAAVRQRVQRLLDAGIMQVVAVTDPLRIGFRRQAMVGIKAQGDVREVARRLAALEDVDHVVVCAGSWDVIVEIVCEDDEQLLQLLDVDVRSIPGVTSTEIFLYLRLEKQTYSRGTR